MAKEKWRKQALLWLLVCPPDSVDGTFTQNPSGLLVPCLFSNQSAGTKKKKKDISYFP